MFRWSAFKESEAPKPPPNGLRFWMLLAALCLLPSAALAQAPDGLAVVRAIEQQFVDVVARCENSVVSIARIPPGSSEPRWGANPLRRNRPIDRVEDLSGIPETFGSGVIIAREGDRNARFILTNYHILQPGGEEDQPAAQLPVTVQLANHHVARASVIAADPRSDLAVLRLDLVGTGIDPKDVTPIPLGDASEIRKGQFVLALGNPYAISRDGSASVSWGLISNISRPARGENEESIDADPGGTIHQYGTLLHVDTRLSLGTSGGALVDLEGRLVGLTTSLAALEGYEKSVGYAIPIDSAMRRVIETLLQGYEVEYGFLGIMPRDARPSELPPRVDQRSAARVEFVSAGSPAYQGGLRPEDLILRINDRPILSANDLMRDVGLLAPGTATRIEVWRPSLRQRFDVDVTLGKWPVIDDSQIIATNRRYESWRGLNVDYPTARRRFLTSDVLERYHAAVLVLNVAEGSAAQMAGLRPGDYISHVEETSVETPEQFQQAVSGREGPVTVTRLDHMQLKIPPSPDG